MPQHNTPSPEPELLDVRAVAELLGISTRNAERLSDAGKMPASLKLGRLRRWSRRSIREWLDSGCPACRKPAGGAR
jgi:excisionase family DNA binding protein